MKGSIIYEKDNTTLYVGLPEDIDHFISEDIKAETDAYLESGCIRCIVFDFSRTVFMDSSGIGALMGRYKRMKEKGGKVMICGVGDRIRRILRIAAIDTLLPEIEKKEKKS